MTEQIDQFKSDLATAVNCCSRENASNTPDFILAEFMERCLQAFEAASKRREDWYGHHLSIGGQDRLAQESCVANHLQPPREKWVDNLTHPSAEYSHRANE